MSRFIISNNNGYYNKIKENLDKYFENLSDFSLNNAFAATYKKLAIDNKNFFAVKNQENEVEKFFICIGTFLYKGKHSAEALQSLREDVECLEEIDGQEVVELKKNSQGCFVVGICDKEKIIIFGDDYNLCDCYYAQEGNNYVVCNTWWNIVNAMHQEIELLPAYEWCQQFSIIDNKSPFKDVFRLKGDEFLEIKGNFISCNKIVLSERKDVDKNYDYEQFLSDIEKEMNKNIRLVKDNFATVSLCATGGVDSRTNLAMMLNNGVEPKLLYWEGNSVMTGTETKDCKIVKMISNSCKLPFQIIDAKSTRFFDNEEEGKRWLEILGEWYGMFGCNSGIFNMLMTAGEFIDFGVGTSWLKDCSLAAFPSMERAFGNREYLELDEFVEYIYIKEEVSRSIKFYGDYRERIYNEFNEVLLNIGYKNHRITKEIASFFEIEYFQRANSRNYNLANTYIFSFPELVTKNMWSGALYTPYKWRERNHLIMDLFVRNSSKNLISIPFYSDIRDMKLNIKTLTLEETKKNTILKSIVKFKHLLGNGKFYEFVKWHYHHINNAKQNEEHCATKDWISPLIEYIYETEFGDYFIKDVYEEEIHFNPKIDLFFLLYAYNCSRNN